MASVIDDPDDGWFGESVAARYDAGRGVEYDPAEIERTVDVLAELAGAGGALELAIGTGRIAVPLAQRGVRVDGDRAEPSDGGATPRQGWRRPDRGDDR